VDEGKADLPAAVLLAERGGRRNFVPVARGFLQRRGAGGGAGPLALFVASHRRRALDLYLLAHALTTNPPHDIALPARVWAAALGLPESASVRVSVSDSWSWLEHQRLIRSERDGKLRRVFLLDETGSGEPYMHGLASERKPDYFKLPYAYWREGWHERLELPALVVLLIALSLRQPFKLPQGRGGQWYGISRDTVRRGIVDLRRHDLLTVRVAWRRTQNSPTGATEERRYTLTGPFAELGRRSRRRPNAQSAGEGS
jgi:hypothetical protein